MLRIAMQAGPHLFTSLFSSRMDIPMPPYPAGSPPIGPESAPTPNAPLPSPEAGVAPDSGSPVWPPSPSDESQGAPVPAVGSGGVPWKTPMILGIVGAGVIVASGVAFGAWWWMRPEPVQAVLAKAMRVSQTVKTAHSTFSVTARFSGPDIPGALERIQFTGEQTIDMSALPEFKQSGSAVVSAVFDSTSPFALAGLNNAQLAIEARMPTSKTAYIRFTNIPNIPLVSLDSFKNQWLALPAQPSESLQAIAAGQIPTTVDVGGFVQKFSALWATLDVTKIIQSTDTEVVGEIPMIHYQMTLTPEMVVAILDVLAGQVLDAQERVAVGQQIGSAIGSVPLELWIGRKDYHIYRVKATPTITVGQQKAVLVLEQTMDRFDEPVSVEAPVDAKPIEQVLTQVLGAGILPGVTPSDPEAVAQGPDNDFDGLSDEQERQLGTNSSNADTDGDGLTDGDEINKYRSNPLQSDSDGDGLSDGDEAYRWSSDPLIADTDQDGFSDGQEVKNRYNPVGLGKMTPQQLRLVQ